jgi:hypothetical protein
MKVCLPPTVLLLIVLPFIARSIREQPSSEDWSEATGDVLETRITIIGSRDRGQYRAGELDYIAEAHVKYEKDGISRDEWIPASEQFTNRPQLESWLSQKKSTLCIVRWNTRNPPQIRAMLT